MTVMLVTTCLTSLVMILSWKRSPLIALSFLMFFGSIELFFFSASLTKFLDGAWLPVLLAVLLMTIMFIWQYATTKKYEHDLHSKVSLEWLLALGENIGVARVPGIGLVYTDLISGVPSNFSRFITNLPAYHRIVVFVCIKYVSVPFVPPAERYLLGRVGPDEHRSYRCIVRYGYRDVHQDVNSFETELVASLVDFIRMEAKYHDSCSERHSIDEANRRLTVIGSSCANEIEETFGFGSVSMGLSSRENSAEVKPAVVRKKVRFLIEEGSSSNLVDPVREELKDLYEACEAGTAFILGHSHVKTKPGSHILKKFAIDIGYNFLKRNCRGPEVALRVPAASLLEVGMVYVF